MLWLDGPTWAALGEHSCRCRLCAGTNAHQLQTWSPTAMAPSVATSNGSTRQSARRRRNAPALRQARQCPQPRRRPPDCSSAGRPSGVRHLHPTYPYDPGNADGSPHRDLRVYQGARQARFSRDGGIGLTMKLLAVIRVRPPERHEIGLYPTGCVPRRDRLRPSQTSR